jgi:quercetin dioxygenase-like cupin family protein
MTGASTSLTRLRELTPCLPALGDMARDLYLPVVQYEIPGGVALSTCLLGLADIAVQDCRMPAGSRFPDHVHETKEIIVVYEGELRVTFGERETVLRRGDVVYFIPGQPHTAEAITDVRCVGITVPAEPGYPKPGRDG